ncbi:MAG: nitroreductase family protein [Dehalococcoidia bacterium]|nr:nitroreductase family protein [Dehalococcoidia bacterium]MYD29136.1 nitroreductase family protein [Dehalococcoidia bacterium]
MPDREPLDVLDAIHTTRAQRFLKPNPIPEDVLWEILDAAIRGPTGGNQQGWGWVVVRDQATKDAIARVYSERLLSAYGYDRVSDEELGTARITRGGIEQGEIGIDARNRRGVVHLAEHFAEVPVIVAPVMRTAARMDDSTRRSGAGLGGSIYGAVQNLMLAARAFDIGTVMTWTFDDSSGIGELLGLPENAFVMALIPLGYLEKGRFSQARRRPLGEVVHWDRWGEQQDAPESGR